MPSSIEELAKKIDGHIRQAEKVSSPLITDVTHDSRLVKSGSVFCAIPGAEVDGHDFAQVAVDAGASGVVVERELEITVPQLLVSGSREAMGHIASAVHGNPSNELTVVGVTGTNGKSSVVQILSDIWEKVSIPSTIVGTVKGARTTPESSDLQRMFRKSKDKGCSAVAMEVSSHALELKRVVGTSFAAAVFTNLGHDHLDFHRTIENYFEAKAALFSTEFTPIGVVNVDDKYGRRLADTTSVKVVPYQLADAENLELSGPTSSFNWRGHRVELHLAGIHNVSNALAAATVAEQIGIDAVDIADALCATAPVQGRFELVDAGQPFSVAVDYAHTPDALKAVLAAGRTVAGENKVIVVFGCGGDRDQEKRPLMGAIAQQLADHIILTSDNPRNEKPEAIVEAIASGFTLPVTSATIEHDRRQAIALAVNKANQGDVVLVVGKGHETEQIAGGVVSHFDDRQVVMQALGEIS